MTDPNTDSRIHRFKSNKNSSNHGALSDILIIGAGVIGLMIAKRLASEGCQVTLLDKQAAGREASFAGGGILSSLQPWQQSDAMLDLIRRSQSQYETLSTELFESTGVDSEYIKSGLVILDQYLSNRERERLKRYNLHTRVTVDTSIPEPADQLPDPLGCKPYEVSQLEISTQECTTKHHLDYLPEVAQIRNPKLIKALRQWVNASPRVSLLEHQAVVGFHLNQAKDKIIAVKTKDRTLAAEKVIIAAGAWSQQLTHLINITIPVRPIKGQMLRIKPKTPCVSPIYLKEHCYLIPRKNGTVIIGSTVEDCGFDKSTTTQALNELFQKGRSMVPALVDAEVIDYWAGLRPGSSQPQPIIGGMPSIQNGFLCTGHFRYGLVSAPASAELMADILLKQCRSPLDAKAYQYHPVLSEPCVPI